MEPRSEEARQSSPAAHPMPTVGDARHALAIYGQQQNFRTVTITFDDPEDARRFDVRAEDGVIFALMMAAGATFEVAT